VARRGKSDLGIGTLSVLASLLCTNQVQPDDDERECEDYLLH
jgi:hypothetical protein